MYRSSWNYLFLVCLMLILQSHLAFSEAEIEGVVVGEIIEPKINGSLIQNSKTSAFLNGVTSLGGALLLQDSVKGLPFTGSTLSDLSSSAFGMQGSVDLANVMVNGVEEAMVYVTELESDTWEVKVVPKAVAATVMFNIAYNAHTDSYDVLKQTHCDAIALYTARASAVIGAEGIREVIYQSLRGQFGFWNGALTETVTAVVIGAGVGVIAHHQKRDIRAEDFKHLTNMMLAIGVGRAVNHAGPGISLSVKHLALSYGFPETIADRTGVAAQASAFALGVSLITGGMAHLGDLSGSYLNQVKGDMTKGIGAVISTQALKPTLENLSLYVQQFVNPSIVQLGGHLVAIEGMRYQADLNKSWHQDLVFGYLFGVLPSLVKDVVDDMAQSIGTSSLSIYLSILAGEFSWLYALFFTVKLD